MKARHFTHEQSAPAYFHFLAAEAWAAKQNWERAWSAWQALKQRKSNYFARSARAAWAAANLAIGTRKGLQLT